MLDWDAVGGVMARIEYSDRVDRPQCSSIKAHSSLGPFQGRRELPSLADQQSQLHCSRRSIRASISGDLRRPKYTRIGRCLFFAIVNPVASLPLGDRWCRVNDFPVHLQNQNFPESSPALLPAIQKRLGFGRKRDNRVSRSNPPAAN